MQLNNKTKPNQFCDLDGIDSSLDFQFLQSFFQAFGDPDKHTN